MRRIAVIGTSGSGKTTLARQLSQRLNVPHIELDAIHWKPNWTPTPAQEMLPIVDRLTRGEGWTVDGNYGSLRHLTLGRADTIIWLDYPMSVVFTRVLLRTFRRWCRNETLWNGNRERMWTQFCTQDSLFLWIIQTWRLHRRDYPKLLREQRLRGAKVVRLCSPVRTEQWLSGR